MTKTIVSERLGATFNFTRGDSGYVPTGPVPERGGAFVVGGSDMRKVRGTSRHPSGAMVIAKLAAENDRLRELLRRFEFSASLNYSGHCPCCLCVNPGRHAVGCEFKEAIGRRVKTEG